MTVTLTTNPGSGDNLWDIYVGLILPDSILYFMTYDPSFSLILDPVPARPLRQITSESLTILNIILPSGLPTGQWYWACVLAKPDLSEISQISWAPFTITAGGTCINVAGTWNTTENVVNTNCGEVPQTEHKTYTITPNGCNISATDSVGGTYSGTVNGNQISMTGSFPDSGGTTTVTSSNITVSEDGNSMSGTASWIWSDGSSSCSGTTQISGTRIF